ncbi:MAG: DUF1788 domain-containing protein [Anaerolineae bacterium]|nr:DUF1788 domain-containing protein [Anaerolineae bacterium]
MLSFKDRLELLEQDLKSTPPAFTMSSDLPFAIFRYDPTHPDEGEWKVRREINLLATRVQNMSGKSVHLLSLAKLYWQSIEESEGVAEIVALEKSRGFQSAQEQVGTYLSDPDWRPLPDLLVEHTAGLNPQLDILFLYRAGVFAPSSYRLSSLLEQMLGKMMIPAVLFYPGTWRGSLNYMGLRSDEEPLGSYRVKIYGRDS